jgi:hypothetical protein
LEEIGLFEPFVNANILLITSHTTKRSFATNYFEKIETPILMEITGHSRESTFLSYIETHHNEEYWQTCVYNKRELFGNPSFNSQLK